MGKTIKIIWNLVTTIIVIAVVILAILLAGVRVVGLQPFTVLSGSMRPAYEVGSLIYVKQVDHTEIRPGDPITFVLDDSLTVATHRVVRVTQGGEYFITKGDANDAEDGTPVYYKNVIGKPVFTIPYLGYLSSFISTRQGMIISVTAALILLILAFIPDMLEKIDNRVNGKKQKRTGAMNNEKTVH